MKKALYVIGSIEIICGLVLRAVICIIEDGYSLEGYDFYSPTASFISHALLIIGVLQLIASYLSRDK